MQQPTANMVICLVWILLVFYMISRPPGVLPAFPSSEGLGGPTRGLYNPGLAAALNQGLRDFWQKPDQVLDALDPLEGLTIADIGCGEGYFSLRLLERVGPEGRVYAADIQEEVLTTLERRIPPEYRDRIQLVHGDAGAIQVDLVDLVLVVQVLGEVSDRADFLAGIRRLMHADSRLVIIDSRHITNPENGFTRPLNTNALMDELTRAGFRTAPEYEPARFEFLPKQFFLVLAPL